MQIKQGFQHINVETLVIAHSLLGYSKKNPRKSWVLEAKSYTVLTNYLTFH